MLKQSFLILTSCFIFSVNAFAKPDLSEVPSGEYELDLSHASIVWKINHFGLSNYVARFTDFDIQLTLDSEKLENSSVSATIQTNSINTEYPTPEKKDFNKVLAEGKDWFNGKEFPAITFKSTKLVVVDATKSKLEGELSLLGMTKPVTLDVTMNGTMASHPFKEVAAIGFSATTTIQREDWGLVKYLPKIGNDVQIAIEGEFLAKNTTESSGE